MHLSPEFSGDLEIQFPWTYHTNSLIFTVTESNLWRDKATVRRSGTKQGKMDAVSHPSTNWYKFLHCTLWRSCNVLAFITFSRHATSWDQWAIWQTQRYVFLINGNSKKTSHCNKRFELPLQLASILGSTHWFFSFTEENTLSSDEEHTSGTWRKAKFSIYHTSVQQSHLASTSFLFHIADQQLYSRMQFYLFTADKKQPTQIIPTTQQNVQTEASFTFCNNALFPWLHKKQLQWPQKVLFATRTKSSLGTITRRGFHRKTQSSQSFVTIHRCSGSLN